MSIDISKYIYISIMSGSISIIGVPCAGQGHPRERAPELPMFACLGRPNPWLAYEAVDPCACLLVCGVFPLYGRILSIQGSR